MSREKFPSCIPVLEESRTSGGCPSHTLSRRRKCRAMRMTNPMTACIMWLDVMTASDHFARLWLGQSNSVLLRLSSRTLLSASLPPHSGPLCLHCLNHRCRHLPRLFFGIFRSPLTEAIQQRLLALLVFQNRTLCVITSPSGPLRLLCLNHRRHLPLSSALPFSPSTPPFPF